MVGQWQRQADRNNLTLRKREVFEVWARNRQTETERQREIETEIDRQTETKRDKERDCQTDRHTDS